MIPSSNVKCVHDWSDYRKFHFNTFKTSSFRSENFGGGGGGSVILIPPPGPSRVEYDPRSGVD